MPEHGGRAIASKVADARDLVTARMRTETGAGAPITVDQLPDVGLRGGGIDPQHIVAAVAIEVADAGDGPTAPRVSAEVDAAGKSDVVCQSDLVSRDARGVGDVGVGLSRRIDIGTDDLTLIVDAVGNNIAAPSR